MPSGVVTSTGSRVCRGGGGGSFLRHHYLLEVLSPLAPVHRILHSKWVLISRWSSPGKIMMLFRHVPQVQRCLMAGRWVPYSSMRCQGHVGSYCYVPSWSVLKTNSTRDPRHALARIPFSGSWVRQTGGKPLPASA
jgi:hypothetical protein